MTSSTRSVTAPKQYEDLLSHLPASSLMEYGKGQLIYSRSVTSKGLYLERECLAD